LVVCLGRRLDDVWGALRGGDFQDGGRQGAAARLPFRQNAPHHQEEGEEYFVLQSTHSGKSSTLVAQAH